MDVFTPRSNRRAATRVRVEIPVSVSSLDRTRPFAENCVVLVVSHQGCGFRSTQMLPIGTPILLNDLPEGGSVTARVVNCLPLGKDGQGFLVGATLYTPGNVWKLATAPTDWFGTGETDPDTRNGAWPYQSPTGAAAGAGRK
jgi:hypothetical protein